MSLVTQGRCCVEWFRRKVINENRHEQRRRRIRYLTPQPWALLAAIMIAPYAHAAWQWQSTGSVSTDTAPGSSGGGISIGPAPGIQSGDTLLLIVAYDDPSGLSGGWNVTPSGWTLVAANDAGANDLDREVAVFCKIAGSSESSVTVTGASNTAVAQGVMLRYTGGTCTVHGANTYIDQGTPVRNIATPFRQITLDNTLTLIAASASFYGIANGVTSWPANAVTRVNADTNSGGAMGILVGEKIGTAAASIASGSIVLVSTNTFRSRGVLVSLAAAILNPTAAPTGIVVTPTGTAVPTTTLRVTWNAATNANHYRVRYKRAVDSAYTLIPTQFTTLTTDITGLSAATTYDVQVGAANSNESVLIWPSNVTQGTTQSLSTIQIKWHPGHYVGITRYTFDSSFWTEFDALVASICSNTNIKGVKIVKTWASLEKNIAGDYGTTGDSSYGFGAIDRALSELAACNKHLILTFAEAAYGSPHTSTPSSSGLSWLIPTYITTNSTYGNGAGLSGQPYGVVFSPVGESWTGSLKTAAMMWTAPVMNRIIALFQAYGQRYNNHPNFEMLATMGETSIGVPTSTGYTSSAHDVQIRRNLQEIAPYWQNTQMRIPLNWSYNSPTLISLCVSLGNCSIGGPDPELPLPTISRSIEGNRCFRGLDGCTDRRGVIPWVGEQQGLGLNTRYFETTAEIQTYQNDTMNASYMIWSKNETWTGTPQGGGLSVLAQINATSGAVGLTSCPSEFSSCATN